VSHGKNGIKQLQITHIKRKMELIHRNTHHGIGTLILKGIHNKEMELIKRNTHEKEHSY